MVSKSGDKIDYELVSIITKDPLTGRMYFPMRMIASRKTTAARVRLFERFISSLKANGLRDPLKAPAQRRLTIATDFETTFSLALGCTLAKNFQPESNLSEKSMRYVEKVCFGSSVHAKRIILEKCSNDKRLYQWLVRTRVIETVQEMDAVLDAMCDTLIH